MSTTENIRIAWTTVETEAQGRELAAALVAARLVACAQVSGPITSFYRWQGKSVESAEYRITLKFPERTEPEILAHLSASHPYEVPQWVSLRLERVLPAYAAWVESSIDG